MVRGVNDEQHIARVKERIRARMKELGLTGAEIAGRLGTTTATVSRLLSPQPDKQRGLTKKWVLKFAAALDCKLVDLLDGDSWPGGITVAVVGYVGAGEQVYNFDDSTPLDYVTPPEGAEDTKAVRVRGDSMYPRYEEGALLFFYPSTDVAPDCLGRTCVVQVKDGPTLVKKLSKGTVPGRYRLVSFKAPEMEDVEILWAARVVWAKEP